MDSNEREMGETIVQNLKKFAEEDPDEEAFIFYNKFRVRTALSCKDVWDKSRMFAAILKHHGIEKGDVVCNTLVNCPEKIITSFGTIFTGAITMHKKLLMADGKDLVHNLNTGQCKAIIVDSGEKSETLNFLEKISYKDANTGELCYRDLPYLKVVIKLKVYVENKEDVSSKWLTGLGDENEVLFEKNINEEDITAIFNTSGTTGFCKLISKTHKSILSPMKLYAIRTNVVYYTNRSIGWLGGFPHVHVAKRGICAYIDYSYGSPESKSSLAIQIFKQEQKPIQANLSSVEVEEILSDLREPLPHLIESLTLSGGPTHKLIVEKALDTITSCVLVVYGGTDFGVISNTVLKKGSVFEDFCAGKVLKGVEVRIIDDDCRLMAIAERGEVQMRSPYMFSAYFNDSEKTREAFTEDGWIKTGDIGYLDKDGQLFVFGRKADAIMHGTSLLYPGWLEAKILKCPGLKRVALIGVPHPLFHEDVCLCMVKTESDEEHSLCTLDSVQEFYRNLFVTSDQQDIPSMPKYFLFFDEFPYNSNLKIDRKVLKTQACDRLGIKL